MFDSAEHFARFAGVHTRTVARWQSNPDSVPAPARRLLDVLGLLEREAPALLAVLIDQARIVKQAAPAPKVPTGPYGGWVERPLDEIRALLASVEPSRSDNQRAWDAGEYDGITSDLDDAGYEALKASLGVV